MTFAEERDKVFIDAVVNGKWDKVRKYSKKYGIPIPPNKRKTVWAYRHGVSDMPLSFLKKVCGATGVCADWILWGGEEHGL